MNLPIRRKIAMLVALLISASILMTGIPLYNRMVDILIEQQQKKLQSISELQVEKIQRNMYDLYRNMGQIRDFYIHDLIEHDHTEELYADAMSFMTSLILQNKHYYSIQVYSAKPPYQRKFGIISDQLDAPGNSQPIIPFGETLEQIKYGLTIDSDAIISPLSRTTINDEERDEQGTTSLYGIQKIFGLRGDLEAILLVKVGFRSLMEQIHRNPDLFQYYYTNENGEVLYTTQQDVNDTLSMQQIVYMEMLFPWASGIVRDELYNKTIHVDEDKDQKRAAFFLRVNYDQRDNRHYLGQIITIPYSELVSGAQQMRNNIIAFMALILIGGVVVAYMFSRHITRPIEVLSDSIRSGHISDNKDIQNLEKRHDEFGMLAGSIHDFVSFFHLQAEEIRRSESQLKAVIDNVVEGVIVICEDGKIESVNQAALQLFGYERHEMVGHRIEMIMPEEYRDYHQYFIHKYRDSGRKSVLGSIRNISGQRKDGSVFDIDLGINEVVLPNKRLFTGVIRDISSQVEYEKNLLAAKHAAEEANLAKSRFLSMMSHEIRTPMNGIMGVIQLLREEKLNDEQHGYIETAYSSAKNLLSILNDILDLSKIESGRMVLEEQEFDVVDEIADLCRLYYRSARDKGIELGMVVDPSIPRRIIADQLHLRQILGNLLNNAIKFTNHGGVYIELCNGKGSSTAWQQQYCFKVHDTGIGIDEEMLANIFEPFVQADSNITREFGGTGLGLSIVNRLVKFLGGRISVKSQKDHGSEFEVYIPCTTVEQQGAAQDSLPRKILLVYTNPVTQIIVERQLALLGAEVESITVADLQDYQPASGFDDLIVESIKVLQDNLVALSRLKTHYQRLFLLSAQTIQDELPKDVVDGVILRPFKIDELYKQLSQNVSPKRLTVKQQEVEFQTSPSLEETNMSADKKILLVEDNQVNQLVATSILKKIGYNATVVTNGEEAVNILQKEPFDLVLMDCHMPVMDGYEATRQIRQLSGDVANIPIVAMTADAATSDRDRCLGVGMNDHMAKPIEMSALKAMVERWIL